MLWFRRDEQHLVTAAHDEADAETRADADTEAVYLRSRLEDPATLPALVDTYRARLAELGETLGDGGTR